MNKNTLLTILVLVLFAGVAVLGLYYLKLTKPVIGPVEYLQQPVRPSAAAAAKETGPTPTLMVEKIPFDYEVVSVSSNQALLKGDKGEATLPNSPNVKIFKGVAPNATASDFSALAVGQKLRVERTISGTIQEVRVYILD